MQPLSALPSLALHGSINLPGDKSISHRSLIFGGLANGETIISGLLEGEDVLHTAQAIRALGASITKDEDSRYHITSPGLGALREPEAPLYFGNAGTGSRLMMGVIASHGFSAVFDGDASLRSRPMGRILTPLMAMGAQAHYHDKADRMPLTLEGAAPSLPISYRLPVASAQVKSAVLLAGLNTMGDTSIIEPVLTRDHTERMIKAFGGSLSLGTTNEGERLITVRGHQPLGGQTITVPGDPSSAAFPLVAALLIQGSDLVIKGMMINPLRTGLLTSLKDMGARISLTNLTTMAGEEIADLHCHYSPLRGVDIPADRAASMIDEYPVLAVAAAFAEGTTIMRGLHELRVKESDRLAAIHAGLLAMGARAEIDGDDLIVHGGRPEGGGLITTHDDHRIAMSFLVMGLASAKGSHIDDSGFINTSFPGFINLMSDLGGRFRV